MIDKTPQESFLRWRSGLRAGFGGHPMDKVFMKDVIYKEAYKLGYELYKREIGKSMDKFGYIPDFWRTMA